MLARILSQRCVGERGLWLDDSTKTQKGGRLTTHTPANVFRPSAARQLVQPVRAMSKKRCVPLRPIAFSPFPRRLASPKAAGDPRHQRSLAHPPPRHHNYRAVNVVLLEDLAVRGFAGEEVQVKPGFARNFLVPNHKAVYATPENKGRFVVQRSVRVACVLCCAVLCEY